MYKVKMTIPNRGNYEFKELYDDVCETNDIKTSFKEDGSIKTIGVGANKIEYTVYSDVQRDPDEKPRLVKKGLFKKVLVEPETDCIVTGLIYKMQGNNIYYTSKSFDDAVATCKSILEDWFEMSQFSIDEVLTSVTAE